MVRFVVFTQTVQIHSYDVEANSMEEAIELVKQGKGTDKSLLNETENVSDIITMERK